MPKFSVVIPVYNMAGYITKALSSVAKQSYNDYEIVVVNDGSTDKSAKKIEAWLKKNPKVQVTFINLEENTGLGATRNRATQESKGEYIAFLDADDTWESNKLQRVEQEIQGNADVDLFYHAVRVFSKNRERDRSIREIESYRDLLLNGNPIIPSATVMKTSVLKDLNGFSIRKLFHGAEDFDLWLRFLKAGYKMKAIDEVLTRYRAEGQGMTAKIDEHIKNNIQVVEHHVYGIESTGEELQLIMDKAIARKYYEAARFSQKHGMHKKARKYYKKSFTCEKPTLKSMVLGFLNKLFLRV